MRTSRYFLSDVYEWIKTKYEPMAWVHNKFWNLHSITNSKLSLKKQTSPQKQRKHTLQNIKMGLPVCEYKCTCM